MLPVVCDICVILVSLSDKILKRGVKPDLDAIQQFFHHGCIAALRNPLIGIVEIIVVKRKADREALDDERRQFPAVASPLLLRVAFHKLLVYVSADQRQRLLLKVCRLPDAQTGDLFLNTRRRLLWRFHMPHLCKRVHVKGKIVELVPIHSHRRVDVVVELRQFIDIAPDPRVRRVEDMRTIPVDVDLVDLLCVDISCDMSPLVDHETPLPGSVHLTGKHGAKKPCADYQIVIVHCLFS